ncbi:Alcohol dehydrogenase, class IV [Sulfitobacter noctilucicola]|uniref:Alcohol dehydrogenase 2 n=1 Tax=Sulfitobacter noctilucicola TaxID=1342301 RepID=A0A7W6MAH0_9RHOB|nr:iron-containing alcohol dehydrogenase [Sulfitobacter noctilucicola]KIN64075.1 Alcohol dehydrogenase, class IV [Sulfitobacter noctilucicola]MBB4175429.1 alcohol dehydrogenase class IV [Sulfitobacter noctilucicola]
MPDFTFNTTPSIRQSRGGASRLGAILSEMPFATDKADVMVVTDPGIMKLGLADGALSSLKESGFAVKVFDAVEPDPKASTVLEAVEIAQANDVACIVGFGGGSSMDVAKVVALLASSGQPIDEAYGVGQATGTRLPLVLVPTTAGTGSEVTAVSILTTGTQEKKGIVSPIILPDIALLDATLTLGLPPHITAATGVDAMVHAIEAYTSKSANNNPVSKMLACQALDLLGANIRMAVGNGDDLDARENMLLGAMLAGQAFANAPVAAVHALAYPVGSLFHVPHGLSNALVLAEVMRFNAPDCAADYAALAPHVFPDIETDRGAQIICAEFIERLVQLNIDLGLPSGLRQVGIADTDIERLAGDSMNQTRLLVNNPREVTHADATQIYTASL